MNKIIVFIVSIFLSLLLAEAILQIIHRDHFFIRRPNRQFILNPDPRYLPGVWGKTKFTVNRLGLRGDELEDQEVRILTLGGSATECGYLDDREAWPYLLQESLASKMRKTVWVGNAGRSSLNMRHHILQTDKLLNQIPNIDLVIFLIGANELTFMRDNYNPMGIEDPSIREECLRLSFELAPRKIRSFKDLQTCRLIKSILLPKLNFRADQSGKWYEERRKQRQCAQKISLPRGLESRLPEGLNEYQENVKKIVRLCREHGTKVLFLTQPSLYKTVMPEHEEILLWGGEMTEGKRSKPGTYLTTREMKRMHHLYNKALQEVGKKENLEVLNLDPIISPRSDSFYDDLHFTEIGSKRVAQAVADFICRRKILSYECATE